MIDNLDNRLMLYLDVLGFSDFIKETPDDILIEKLKCYEQIFTQFNDDESFQQTSPSEWIFRCESIVISDSILISCAENYPEEYTNTFLEYIPKESINKRDPTMLFLNTAAKIQQKILVDLGLLVRGIIHIGPLYHKGHMIVGKGFVQAFELEKKMKNPVIYLSEEYYKRYRPKIDDMLGGDKWFREDQDGNKYLFPSGLINKDDEDNKRKINNLIQQGISKASDLSNNEPLRKWRWLEAKLNDYYSRN